MDIKVENSPADAGSLFSQGQQTQNTPGYAGDSVMDPTSWKTPEWIANIGRFFGIDSRYSTSGRQLSAQEKQRQYNAFQAKLNREYQEYMSNTSMQRRTADLKKAGLNPILAFGGNGGMGEASTPGGGSASAEAGRITPATGLTGVFKEINELVGDIMGGMIAQKTTTQNAAGEVSTKTHTTHKAGNLAKLMSLAKIIAK